MATHERRRGRARVLVALGLLLFQAWCLYPLHRTMDLPVWDELSFYALHGKRFLTGAGGLQSIEYGPLYSLLYAPVLAVLELAEATFAMRYGLTLAVTLLLFLVLARALDSTRAAFLLALVWAASEANLVIGTMAFHLSLALTLSALLLAPKTRIAALLCLALGGFVRPESFVLAVGYGALLAARRMGAPLPGRSAERSGTRAPWFGHMGFRLLIVAQLTLLAVLVTQVASWRFNTGRSWLAVQQHYAFAQVMAGRYDIDPWADFPLVTAREFPSAWSVGDVLRTHPGAIVAHIGGNLASVPGALWRFLTPHEALRVPLAFGVVLPGALLVLGAWLCRDRARFRSELRALVARTGDAPLLALVAPCTLLPSFLVSLRYPQYMLVLMPFAALATGVVGVAALRSFSGSLSGSGEASGGTGRLVRTSARLFPPFVGVGLAVLMAFSPSPQGAPPARLPVREKVEALRALVQPMPEVVYGGSLPSYLAHLSYTSRAVYPLNQNQHIDLAADLARERPGLVAIDANLLCSPFFDPGQLHVLAGPEWRCHPFPDEVVYERVDPSASVEAPAGPRGEDVGGDGYSLLLPFNWRAWGHTPHQVGDWPRRILSVPGRLWVFTQRPRRAVVTVRAHADTLGGPTVLPYTTSVVLNGAVVRPLEVAAGATVVLELDLAEGYNQIWFGDDFPTPNAGFVPAAHTAVMQGPRRHPLDLVSIELRD